MSQRSERKKILTPHAARPMIRPPWAASPLPTPTYALSAAGYEQDEQDVEAEDAEEEADAVDDADVADDSGGDENADAEAAARRAAESEASDASDALFFAWRPLPSVRSPTGPHSSHYPRLALNLSAGPALVAYVPSKRRTFAVTYLISLLQADTDSATLRRVMSRRYDIPASPLAGLSIRDAEYAIAMYLDRTPDVRTRHVMDAMLALRVRITPAIVDCAVRRMCKGLVLAMMQHHTSLTDGDDGGGDDDDVGPPVSGRYGRTLCRGIPEASFLRLLTQPASAPGTKTRGALQPLDFFVWMWHELAWSDRVRLADRCVVQIMEQLQEARQGVDGPRERSLHMALRRLELVELAVHAEYVPEYATCKLLVLGRYYRYIRHMLLRRLLPDAYVDRLLHAILEGADIPFTLLAVLRDCGMSERVWTPELRALATARPVVARALHKSRFVRTLGLMREPPTSPRAAAAVPMTFESFRLQLFGTSPRASASGATPDPVTFFDNPHSLPALIAPGCAFMYR